MPSTIAPPASLRGTPESKRYEMPLAIMPYPSGAPTSQVNTRTANITISATISQALLSSQHACA